MVRLKRYHKKLQGSIACARGRKAKNQVEAKQEVETVLQWLIEKVVIEEEESTEIAEEVVIEEVDEYHNDPDFYDLTVVEDNRDNRGVSLLSNQ